MRNQNAYARRDAASDLTNLSEDPSVNNTAAHCGNPVGIVEILIPEYPGLNVGGEVAVRLATVRGRASDLRSAPLRRRFGTAVTNVVEAGRNCLSDTVWTPNSV